MVTINIPTFVEIAEETGPTFVDNSINYTININYDATVYEFVDTIARVMRQFGYEKQCIYKGFKNYLDINSNNR